MLSNKEINDSLENLERKGLNILENGLDVLIDFTISNPKGEDALRLLKEIKELVIDLKDTKMKLTKLNNNSEDYYNFQQTVMDVVGKISPVSLQEIIKKLKEQKPSNN